MDIAAQLQQALSLHQSGQLLEAGHAYRSILQYEPNNVDALNLLGVVMQATGDLELAENLISRATELAPDYFAAFANLGNVLQASGRMIEAIDAFQRALELNSKSVETHNNISSAFNEVKRFDKALSTSNRALKLQPQFPEALVNKGNALLGLGQTEDALKCYEEALQLAPDHESALFNLGHAQFDLENFEAAIRAYRKALAQEPGNPEKQFNLANALLKAGWHEESLEPFGRALTLNPGYIDALCNQASALQCLGRTHEAIICLRKALELDPDSPDLHWNLSLTALQHGDYTTGWSEYEWRWKTPTFAAFKRNFGKPPWNGEPLNGRRILIHTEQGFGDNIQFCRYVPKVAAAGGRVVLECRPELNRLFSTLDGVGSLVNLGEQLPEFDLHVPLMSLPHLFKTTLEEIPGQVPYLSVPDGVEENEQVKIADGLKVGLVWAGSPTRVDNHIRSIEFSDLTPLFNILGATFFSLQVGSAKQQLFDHGSPSFIKDLSSDFLDFADTAAAVSGLDLVISVDTSVLHLAGALGKPGWALLSQPAGFLWMDNRSDSAWYPVLKLFRQQEKGQWHPVIKEIQNQLSILVHDSQSHKD